MAKTLNFNGLKKQYLTVVLPDDKKTTLMVGTPTKAIFDEFTSIKDSLEGDNMEEEALNELYGICAKLLSRNKGGIKISKETVAELFDFEDVIVFIRAYTDFIHEVTNSKN